MQLYSPFISPRLHYIIDFISTVIGERIDITNDTKVYCDSDEPKINYSEEKLADDEIRIIPQGLLFQKGIIEQPLECGLWEGKKIFFLSGGDIPFDIFSASFFLLSRYEEYLPHTKDMYGRYAFEQSTAYKENFLDQPLVNHWVIQLRSRLLQKFKIDFKPPSFSFLPTYDIDEAWSYKYKSAARVLGASAKNILKGQFAVLTERRKVRSGEIVDPFDAYQWMDDLHETYKLSPIYFFLVAGKTGKFDRNILPAQQVMQNLIRSHAGKYDIGVHPSWQSGDNRDLLRSEIKYIESLTRTKVSRSRQHFIRMTLPYTYRALLNAGIRDDYSMGYGSVNGFRASVASSFKWYDLEKDEVTGMVVHPFCFMDANAFFEQKSTPAEALEEMHKYYKEVRKVDGEMIIIWHNTFLGTAKLFKGWREVYQQFIAQIS